MVGLSRVGTLERWLTLISTANTVITGRRSSPVAIRRTHEEDSVVREKVTSTAIAAAMLFGLGVASAPRAVAAQLVQECAPPGGLWGPGNTFRGKIEKFADTTLIFMSQNFAEPDSTRWFKSTPLSWSGGPFTNGMGRQSVMVSEGDGYKVTFMGRSNYYVHFSCVPAAAPK